MKNGNCWMRAAKGLLAGMIGVCVAAGQGQAPPAFSILVIGGEGSINNVKQRTAREPIVEVRDRNNRPISGAAVLFEAPREGASGTFTGGSPALRVTTDAQGRAMGQGFQPNAANGSFTINVTVTVADVVQTAVIHMTNVAGAGSGHFLHLAGHGKLIAIVATVGAAAAAGTVAAVKSGGGSAPTTAPTTISAGTGTVGAR
jgi:hypothetical protein